MDGYYGLTNLSHIGVGYYVANYLRKVHPKWRGDDSEPFIYGQVAELVYAVVC